jgi:DNA-binding MarR family transcriptional regulator
VLDFMRVIWALDHSLQQSSRRMRKALGVTGPQRFVIRIVGRFPGIPAGDLARLLHVHPSTLSGVLARLESAGLIRRRADPRDARRSLLGLTEQGRRIDAGSEGTVEAAVGRALGRLAPDELETAREVLQRVADSLGGAPAADASRP